MNVQEFILKHGICMEYHKVPSNPHLRDLQGTHFRCAFSKGDGLFKCYFSFGYGHKNPQPTAKEVLACVLSDARCAEDTFEEFCGNFGYDDDSLSAYRTWEACRRTDEELREWLGDDLHQEFRECEECE